MATEHVVIAMVSVLVYISIENRWYILIHSQFFSKYTSSWKHIIGYLSIHFLSVNSKSYCIYTVFRLKFLPPATKLGQGYVFTGVCDSVNRGGTSYPLEQTPPWEQTPPEQTPPGVDTTPEQTHPPRPDPPGSRHPPQEQTPPEQTPPGADTPHPPGSRHTPLDQTPPPGADPPWWACCEIRSTCGQYASYWTATCGKCFPRMRWKRLFYARWDITHMRWEWTSENWSFEVKFFTPCPWCYLL